MGPVTARWNRFSQFETVRVPPNDRQQPTTKHTACFAGNTLMLLRSIRGDAMSCEARKTLSMAPENELILLVPWKVNDNTN